jgi:YbbR domain-containing protein
MAAGLLARSTPNVVEVVLRGSQEAVAGIEPDDVTAYVDLAGLGVGEYMLAVRVDGPQRAGVARVLPATVQVKISSGKN